MIKRVIALGLAAVLVTSALVVAEAAPAAADVTQGEGVHAIASQDDLTVYAAVKADGRLYTRFIIEGGPGWSPFQQQGLPGWASVALAIQSDGPIHLAAVKEDGRLFTRAGWRNGDLLAWDGWVSHGLATWSPERAPSIAALEHSPEEGYRATAVLGAIKSDGRLYTRELSVTAFSGQSAPTSSWGGWTLHGLPTWSRVDVAIEGGLDLGTLITGLRSVWFVGVKQDGRLLTRKRDGLNGAWGGYVSHGLPTWAPGAEPSISASSLGADSTVAIGAVKADGRLYTRLYENDTWAAWLQHGGFGWVAADTVFDRTRIYVVGVKDNGALYSRWVLSFGGDQLEGPWTLHGLPTWSTQQPRTAGASVQQILAIKDDGRLYTRRWSSSWDPFGPPQGLPSWDR